MKNDNKRKMQQKELMFCLSRWLPEAEAYALAKSMKTPDKWYLYKVSENPTAKHIQDRESFVVLTPFREGEAVRAGDRIFVDKRGLVTIS